MTMSGVTFALAFLAYVGAAGGAVGALATRRAPLAKGGARLTVAGVLLHTLTVILQTVELGRPPLGNLGEALSFSALALALLSLATEFRFGNRLVGAFLLPLVAVFTGAAALLPREVARAAAGNAWIWIHVTLVMLGSAAFAFIFGVGLMYLLQERQLKAKAPVSLAFRLPPLEVLDRLAYEALWLGFPLLTVGILLGSLQAQHLWGTYWVWGTKETWSLLTWLIYGLLLLARLNAGMRGRKAAILSIVGFAAVLLTFLGVSLMASPRLN
ncbi:MAG: cytochrome c biogenesis protein CcsA [candidate division NC10 bacterium]|nr:cytochrome c biogenesis protein CcsA [candidate division NC10 bacterium]